MPFHLNTLAKHPPNPSGESDLYLLPALSTIQLRAWLSTPIYSAIYPGPPSTHPGIIANMISRHKTSLLDDPTCHIISLLHCTDPEVGEPWKPVAFVKYHVFSTRAEIEQRTDTGKRTWPEGVHLALLEHFWGRIASMRQKYGQELGPHVDVEILATDPEYQRIGAGRMLMDEVCKVADQLGLPAYLEGSEEGRRLYEACGFEGKEPIWVDLQRWENGGDKGKDWRGEGVKEGEGEGWYNNLVMLRPAKGR